MASVDVRYALALREKRRRERAASFDARSWFNIPTAEGGAREQQKPPDGDWRFWMNLAGRGYGKTRIIVEWARDQAREMPGSRGIIVGATGADVRDILVEGESGFLSVADDITYWPGKQQLQWANGSMAYLRSAEKPDRLRGPQGHWAIADELAAWSYAQETWDMLMFGLRLGNNPRCAIATTPRPTKIVRDLVKDENTAVSRGTTYDNRDNLAPAFYAQIIKKYEGTRLGRQELNAEILDDVPGALWKRADIDEYRIGQMPESTAIARVIVGMDPPASDTEESAECGIIVAARGRNGHGFVFDDYSMRGSVDERLDAILSAYRYHRADRIIVEKNNGGDWIPHAIRQKDPTCAVSTVWASRGKATRAEPVAAFYEQGRVHHVGVLTDLEDQLCTWTPEEASPDRLDALVWALTDLMIKGDGGVQTVPNVVNFYGSRKKSSEKHVGRGVHRRRRK